VALSEYEGMPLHVSYPHEYDRLYDCPGCEAECWCDNVAILLGEQTECIFCESLHDTRGSNTVKGD